jgi:hypothetical protein
LLSINAKIWLNWMSGEVIRFLSDAETIERVVTRFVRVLNVESSIFILESPLVHVRWVSCHHGMARPQVADGGDTRHVRSVSANILISSHGKSTSGGLPAWGWAGG